MEHLPIVEVSVKFSIVTDVNLAEQTFRACFILYLEWFDASIRTAEEAKNVDFDHFVPSVSFENDVGEVQQIGNSRPRQGDFVGHMKFLRKYAGALLCLWLCGTVPRLKWVHVHSSTYVLEYAQCNLPLSAPSMRSYAFMHACVLVCVSWHASFVSTVCGRHLPQPRQRRKVPF